MAKRTNMRTGKATTKRKRLTGTGMSGSKTGAGLHTRAEGFRTPSAGRTAGNVGAYGDSPNRRLSVPAASGAHVSKGLRGKGDAAASKVGSHGQKTIKRSGKPSRLRG